MIISKLRTEMGTAEVHQTGAQQFRTTWDAVEGGHRTAGHHDAVSLTSAKQIAVLKVCVPVKVGRGREVHAGIQIGTEKKGRLELPILRHACGSGNSSMAHNHRRASVKKAEPGSPVTCQNCLRAMEDKS